MKSSALLYLDDLERLERLGDPLREEDERLKEALELGQAIQADARVIASLLSEGDARARAAAGALQQGAGNQAMLALLEGGEAAGAPALEEILSPGQVLGVPQTGDVREKAEALLESAPIAMDTAHDVAADAVDGVQERVAATLADAHQQSGLAPEHLATVEPLADELAGRDLEVLARSREIEETGVDTPVEPTRGEVQPDRLALETEADSPTREDRESGSGAPSETATAEPVVEEPARDQAPGLGLRQAPPETETQTDVAQQPVLTPEERLALEAEEAAQRERAEADRIEQQHVARAIVEGEPAADDVESAAPAEPEFDPEPVVQAPAAEAPVMAAEPAQPVLETRSASPEGLTETATIAPVATATVQVAKAPTVAAPTEMESVDATQPPADDGAPALPSAPTAGEAPSIGGEEIAVAGQATLPTAAQYPGDSASRMSMPRVPVQLPREQDRAEDGAEPPKTAAQVEAEAERVGKEGQRKLAIEEAKLRGDARAEAEDKTFAAQSIRDGETEEARVGGDRELEEARREGADQRAEAAAQGEDDKQAARTEASGRRSSARAMGLAAETDAAAARDQDLEALATKERAEVAARQALGQREQTAVEQRGAIERAQIRREGESEKATARAWGQGEEARVRREGEAEQRRIRSDARSRAQAELRRADAQATSREAAARADARRRLASGQRERERIEREMERERASRPWYKRAASWVSARFDDLKNAAGAAWNAAKSAARAVVDRAIQAGQAIRRAASRAATAIYQAADRACGGVLSRVANKVREVGQAVVAKVRQAVTKVASRLADAARTLRDRVTEVARAVVAGVVAIRDRIASAALAVRDVCVAAIRTARAAVAGALRATASWLRAQTLRAVRYVAETYKRVRDEVTRRVKAITQAVTKAIQRAYEVCAKALSAAATWLSAAWEKFAKWAQEAFVKFWMGPWRDILIGVAIALVIAAVTVVTGGAGLLLIVAISAAAGGTIRAGGEVAARRAAVAIKNDPERAERFAKEVSSEGDHAQRWYDSVKKDEGWGRTLKYGAVEGVRGAVEGAVMGVAGAGAGAIGTRLAASLTKSMAQRGAMTLGTRALVKSAEWGTRSVVDFGLGLGGDVAAGHVNVELDVAMGLREREEAYQFHVGRYLHTNAMMARFAGSGLQGGLRMGSHMGPNASVQDKLVDRIVGSGGRLATRTVTQQVTRQVVDMSIGGAEGGTTAGLISVANGGTFQDGFQLGFVGGVSSHAGRLTGERFARSAFRGAAPDVAGPRAPGVEVEVEGGGGHRRVGFEDSSPDGRRRVPTPAELNAHQAERLNRILPGAVEGIPAGTRIVADGVDPLPAGAMRVSDARRYLRAVSALRKTATGQEALGRMTESGVAVTMGAGGTYVSGRRMNLGPDTGPRHRLAGQIVHESHHVGTRTDLPDAKKVGRAQFVDAMLRNEAEAQARLLEFHHESASPGGGEYGARVYQAAYDDIAGRLRTHTDLSDADIHIAAMEAGTMALTRSFAGATPSTSVDVDPATGRRVLLDGAPETYADHYGGYWDRQNRGAVSRLDLSGADEPDISLRRVGGDDTKAHRRMRAAALAAELEGLERLERMPMPEADDGAGHPKPEVDTSDDPDPMTVHDGKEHKPRYERMGDEVFKRAPNMSDVNQGYLADCYLIAGIGAVAKQRPDLIQRMITDHGDGTVTVTLYKDQAGNFLPPGAADAQTVKVRVTKDLPTVSGTSPTYARGAQGEIWPALIEKAFAVHVAKGKYQGLNTGGSAGSAMDTMIGGRSRYMSTTGQSGPDTLVEMKRMLDDGQPVAVGSLDKGDYESDPVLKKLADEKTVFPWHAYVLDDVDVDKNEVRLYNPWGKRHPQPLTIEEFQKLYRSVYAGEPEVEADVRPLPDHEVGIRETGMDDGPVPRHVVDSPLDAHMDDILKSPAAQRRLYGLAQEAHAEATGKIETVIARHEGATGGVLLKRDGQKAFIAAVQEKFVRKAGKYTRAGDVGDMVRGRISVVDGADVDRIVADVQAAFPKAEIDAKPDSAYPRVHLDVELDNGVRFELQVGTEATTKFLQDSMIELPGALHKKVGKTRGNFHVAKYDIVDKIQDPVLRERYGLDAYEARYNEALRKTGSGNFDEVDTAALTRDLGAIMLEMEKDNPAFLQSLYTKGPKKPAPTTAEPDDLFMPAPERRRLDEPLSPDTDAPVHGETPGKQRRWSVEQYVEMWEKENGVSMSESQKKTIARGCIGITAVELDVSNPPLEKVYATFDQAQAEVDRWNKHISENADKIDPATGRKYGEYKAVMFAKLFWSNQNPDAEARKVPSPDAYRPDPETGRVDMSEYRYRPQPGMINFDYGFWDNNLKSFWHANHSEPGMEVYQSTKEKFAAGYRDFDRVVYGVAVAKDYDAADAARRTH